MVQFEQPGRFNKGWRKMKGSWDPINAVTGLKRGLVLAAEKTKMTMRAPAKSIFSKAWRGCLGTGFQERKCASRHRRE